MVQCEKYRNKDGILAKEQVKQVKRLLPSPPDTDGREKCRVGVYWKIDKDAAELLTLSERLVVLKAIMIIVNTVR